MRSGPDFPVPFNFGWIFLDLSTTITGNANPPEDPEAAQAWVIDPIEAEGRFSGGHKAVQMKGATKPGG